MAHSQPVKHREERVIGDGLMSVRHFTREDPSGLLRKGPAHTELEIPELHGNLSRQRLTVGYKVHIDRHLSVFLEQLTNGPIKLRLEIWNPFGEFLCRCRNCLR